MSKDYNLQANLSEELCFLVNCCKIDPSDDDIIEILSYLNSSGLDISTLIRLANQHGILPLVYKTIKKLSLSKSSLIDTNILTELKVSYMSISQRNMLMSAELIRIMKLLEENNIEALSFKGPVLSQMAYGDITLRQYSDLDILVDEKDVYTTSQLLIKHDFQLSIDLKYLDDSALFDLSKDVNLYNKNNNILLELHWSLFEKNLQLNSRYSKFWAHPTYIDINNSNIKTLSTNLLLLYLCIHGSKHIWERIEWIVDLDRIIRIHPTINWKKIIQLAHEQHTINMLLLGLSLSSEFFDTQLPENIKVEIDKNSVVKELIKTTIEYLNAAKKTSINTGFRRFQYYNLLQGKSSNKLQQLSHVLFDISKEDYMAFKLPRNLKSLYYLIRPIRLMYAYSSIYFVQFFKIITMSFLKNRDTH